jgi:hypothetical protein
VAGPPLLDTGQLNIITYLFIFLLPIIIISLLMRSVLPKNPMSLRFLKTTIFRGTPWAFRGHRGPIWCRRRKVKTKVKNRNPETTATTRHWLRAHLFAFTMAFLKGDSTSGQVLFDSDSFPICIDIHTSTNTPIFHMASSSSTYRSFAATFETMEAPFFQRETTLQLPGPWFPRENVIPEEFVAKEDLHQGEKKSVDAANEKDDTDCISNLPSSPVEEDPSNESIRRGSLTFYLNRPEAEKEDSPLSAADDPAELMWWHYRLGHLTFAKLKQLALNGKILKKLALLNPPKCAGCLFGAMTKIPWHGKESKSSHKVFAATKPGEMVSVDQMVSTKVGVFTKHTFEKFTAEYGVRINHYHCDNDLYADNAFKESCKSSCQRLTFCGVNAHF